MPLFAFANAGVKIDLSLQHAGIGFGILAGLVFGKPLGIMIFALIAVKTGIARLPQAVNWRSLLEVRPSRRNRFHHVTIHCHAGVRRYGFG